MNNLHYLNKGLYLRQVTQLTAARYVVRNAACFQGSGILRQLAACLCQDHEITWLRPLFEYGSFARLIKLGLTSQRGGNKARYTLTLFVYDRISAVSIDAVQADVSHTAGILPVVLKLEHGSKLGLMLRFKPTKERLKRIIDPATQTTQRTKACV